MAEGVLEVSWAKVFSKLAVLFTAVAVSQVFAIAQTFTILHSFTGGADGSFPNAGLILDRTGNLYGTAGAGGAAGNGTVFKLSYRGSGWVLDPLYSFQGGNDGANPEAPVVFGPDGSLYGTTAFGGGCTCGTVFKLRPAANATGNALGQWTETILHSFTGTNGDGINPWLGDTLTFDSSGNIYGTASGGGSNNCMGGCGIVFELSPGNGGWTENIVYGFSGGSDGAVPWAGLIRDSGGNLYGTATQGGSGYGTIYQLTSNASGWSENTIYTFTHGNDGATPYGGLLSDQGGNLYGTAAYGGSGNGGTAFELMPSGGGWNYSLMFSFNGAGGPEGPLAGLAMDAAGNLYGTTMNGAYGYGGVFELTPTQSGWVYTDLHDFQGGTNDGNSPFGGVAIDANGNLYGITAAGGSYNSGVVWEITMPPGMGHFGKLQPKNPIHPSITISK